MIGETQDSVGLDELRRQVRLLMLLDGADLAGIAPLRVNRLHTYAYLSNVLAPVWDARVFDGRLLKQKGGPFYPELQHDLDRLVGSGLVVITGLGHKLDEGDRWRLDGSFALNREMARERPPCSRHLSGTGLSWWRWLMRSRL